jgi:hypothetical protein
MPAPLIKVLGQPSWRIRTPRIDAFVTQTGAHLAPVTFDRTGRKIAPLSVAPWATEKLDRSAPNIIKGLRGDFFCMPFGGNTTPYRNEKHPVHGETANARWKFQSLDRAGDRTRLHLSLKPRVRPGRVDKYIFAAHDHDAIYQRHVITGMTGPMPIGHHAMLKFPDEAGAGVVSTSRFIQGQVFPEPVEQPENRGYSILKPGATFDTLGNVPMITGDSTDLSRYPARRGFEDIVMLVADDSLDFAWTAVAFPKQRYAWFALKDPRILRSTIFWISNGGRHYAPWNGRHINVMGLEEVTSYFHGGIAESVAKNPLNQRGIATFHTLVPDKPLVVNYIFGVAQIPAGFDRVADITASKGGVTLISDSGKKVTASIDVRFLNQSA